MTIRVLTPIYKTVIDVLKRPVIYYATPNSGYQGETLDVVITGEYFTNTTHVEFWLGGITVNSFVVDSDEQITANLTIDDDADVGKRYILVETLTGWGILFEGFTIKALERYEYYDTGQDDFFWFWGVVWAAQTFTPSIAHTIKKVRLLLCRAATTPPSEPGTITASIRATDVDGHPTGEDLCSGTTDGNTLPEEDTLEWREITLGDGYTLEANTKYAIVVRAPDGTYSVHADWGEDTSSPTYINGNAEYSDDGGTTWYTFPPNTDCLFEEWGQEGE